MVFAELLRDEVGNSHTGRNLNLVWKAFLTEIDHEIQQYQVYRAYRSTQQAHGREVKQKQPSPISLMQNWNNVQSDGLPSPNGPSETRRRSMR
jgi:hypothetical protein